MQKPQPVSDTLNDEESGTSYPVVEPACHREELLRSAGLTRLTR